MVAVLSSTPMPSCRVIATAVVSFTIGLCAAARADSFTIDQWSLGVSAYRAWPDVAGVSITTVTNPLIASHQVSLPSDPRTTAAAQYLMSWMANYGSFRIDAQELVFHQASDTVWTSASGSISITPTEDLWLSIQGSYSYDLHGWMSSDFDVWVGDPVSHVDLFNQPQTYDTIDGPPYYGTFYVNTDLVLPAGTTWVLGYLMRTFAEPGSGNLSGTGSGSLTFEVTPEPTTLTLLLPLLFMVFRHAGRPFKHSDA